MSTQTSSRHEELAMRMLGQTVSLDRAQWEELADTLRSDEARARLLQRIDTLTAAPAQVPESEARR